ncbi:MAG: hypothetical protein KDE47_01650 [Caldilineaceae bacterium]|nr:hypothetical protein [Caldilineaceae bacterium]
MKTKRCKFEIANFTLYDFDWNLFSVTRHSFVSWSLGQPNFPDPLYYVRPKEFNDYRWKENAQDIDRWSTPENMRQEHYIVTRWITNDKTEVNKWYPAGEKVLEIHARQEGASPPFVVVNMEWVEEISPVVNGIISYFEDIANKRNQNQVDEDTPKTVLTNENPGIAKAVGLQGRIVRGGTPAVLELLEEMILEGKYDENAIVERIAPLINSFDVETFGSDALSELGKLLPSQPLGELLAGVVGDPFTELQKLDSEADTPLTLRVEPRPEPYSKQLQQIQDNLERLKALLESRNLQQSGEQSLAKQQSSTQKRGMKVGTAERVREMHRLLKTGMSQRQARAGAQSDVATYYKYCLEVTGEEPIIPYR